MRFVKFTAMVFVASLFIGLGASQKVAAQTVPFFIAGSGNVTDGLVLDPTVVNPHKSIGYATAVGLHTGEGEIRFLGFTSPSTGIFESGVPYKFTSLFNRRNTLACNYGKVDATPGASEPGSVTLYPVEPEKGIFYAVFLAEFTPALDECTGRFRRLTDGNFLMLAVSEPFQVVVDTDGVPTNLAPVSDDPDGQIQYSWYGVGTLTYGRR